VWTAAAVSIDVIARQPPFSFTIFRELARNAFEEPASLEPIRRWTMSPSFYIRTVKIGEHGGSTVDPRHIIEIGNTARDVVRMFTGGRLRAAVVRPGRAPGPSDSDASTSTS
jgi:hypothetical protein